MFLSWLRKLTIKRMSQLFQLCFSFWKLSVKLVKNFSHYVGWLLSLKIVSWLYRIFFSFMRSYLSIVGLNACPTGLLFRKSFPMSISLSMFLTLSSIRFRVHVLYWDDTSSSSFTVQNYFDYLWSFVFTYEIECFPFLWRITMEFWWILK